MRVTWPGRGLLFLSVFGMVAIGPVFIVLGLVLPELGGAGPIVGIVLTLVAAPFGVAIGLTMSRGRRVRQRVWRPRHRFTPFQAEFRCAEDGSLNYGGDGLDLNERAPRDRPRRA